MLEFWKQGLIDEDQLRKLCNDKEFDMVKMERKIAITKSAQ